LVPFSRAYRADNGLPAFMDVDVLDDDFLLSGLAFKPG
jgi:hypothetical protein